MTRRREPRGRAREAYEANAAVDPSKGKEMKVEVLNHIDTLSDQARMMQMLEGGDWGATISPDEPEEAEVLSAVQANGISSDGPAVVPTDLDETDEGDVRYLCRGSRMHTAQIQGPIPNTGEVEVNVEPNPDDTVMRLPDPALVAQSVPRTPPPPPPPENTAILPVMKRDPMLDVSQRSSILRTFCMVYIMFGDDAKPSKVRLLYNGELANFVLAIPRSMSLQKRLTQGVTMSIVDFNDEGVVECLAKFTLELLLMKTARDRHFPGATNDECAWAVKCELTPVGEKWLVRLRWTLGDLPKFLKVLSSADQLEVDTAQVRVRKEELAALPSPPQEYVSEPALPREPTLVVKDGEEVEHEAPNNYTFPGFVPTATHMRPQVVLAPDQVRLNNKWLLIGLVLVIIATTLTILAYLRVKDGIPPSPPAQVKVDCYQFTGGDYIRCMQQERQKKQ